MLTRIGLLIGFLLIIAGILGLIGVYTIGTVGAWPLIIIGAVLLLVIYFVLPGDGAYTYRGRGTRRF